MRDARIEEPKLTIKALELPKTRRSGSPSRTHLGLLMALCASSGVGCDESASADAMNGAAGRPDRGATCEGEPVSYLPDEPFYRDIESGDVQLVHHTDGRSLHEQSLLTGEITPLFELDEPNYLFKGRVAIDERDIYQVSRDGILRFDRAARELSLFAPHPEPGEDPALPRDPRYSAIAISETHLASLMIDRFAWSFTANLYPSYVVAIIERASGARRFIPVDRPIEGTVQLYAHGHRFFHVRSIDVDPDRSDTRAGEIYAYDFDTGTPEPFLESSSAFDDYGIKFWQGSMLATVRAEGGGHQNLVRVPISGGQPEILTTNVLVPYDSFAVSGNTAFVLVHDENAETNGGGRLTAIDLANGEARTIGTCDASPFHGSDDHIYVHAGSNTLRMIP